MREYYSIIIKDLYTILIVSYSEKGPVDELVYEIHFTRLLAEHSDILEGDSALVLRARILDAVVIASQVLRQRGHSQRSVAVLLGEDEAQEAPHSRGPLGAPPPPLLALPLLHQKHRAYADGLGSININRIRFNDSLSH